MMIGIWTYGKFSNEIIANRTDGELSIACRGGSTDVGDIGEGRGIISIDGPCNVEVSSFILVGFSSALLPLPLSSVTENMSSSLYSPLPKRSSDAVMLA